MRLIAKVAAAVGTAVAFIAMAGCGATAGRPGSEATLASASLRGCYVTVDLVSERAAVARPFVPAGVKLGSYYGSGRATVVFWFVSCDKVAVGERRPRPAMISLVGVQIASTASDSDVEQSPALFDHYLVAAASNDPEFVRALRQAGVPIELASAMTFRRTGDANQSGDTSRPGIAIASVTAPGGSFSVSFRATQPGDLEPLHEHADSFWYTHAGRSVRFELMLHHARDRACAGDASIGCHAYVITNQQSTIARLIGATSVSHDLVAIDHEKVATGTAIVNTQALAGGRAPYIGPPRPSTAPNNQSPFQSPPYLRPQAPLSPVTASK